MARISLGSFGEAVARPSGPVLFDGPDAGQGMSGIVAGLNQVAERQRVKLDQDKRIELQGRSQIADAEAASFLDKINDEAVAAIGQGQHVDEAQKVYESKVDEMIGGLKGRFAEDELPQIEPGLEAMKIASLGKFRKNASSALSARSMSNFTESLDLFRGQAVKDPEGSALRAKLAGEQAIQSGADPAQVRKLVDSAGETYRYDSAAHALEIAPNIAALTKQRKEWLDPENTKLDPDRKLVLANQAEARINQMKAEQEAAKRRSEADLRERGRDAIDALSSGLQLSTQTQNEISALMRAGGETGQAVRFALQNQASIVTMSALPFAEQRALIQAEAEKSKAGLSLDQTADLASKVQLMEKSYAQNVKAFQAAPLTYAAERAKIPVPPINPLDPVSGMMARLPLAQFASTQTGVVVPLLEANEAATLAQQMLSLSPTKRAEAFAKAAKVQDSEKPYVNATFAALGKTYPLLAQEALLSSNNRVMDGVAAGPMLGRGADALTRKDFAFKDGARKDLTNFFDTRTGDVFLNDEQARTNAMEGYMATYAGLAVQTEGATNGEYQSRLAKKAFKLYFGGEDKRTVRGGDILLPYGMDENQFKTKLSDDIRVSLATNGGYSPKEIEAIALKSTPRNARGGYSLVFDGKEVVDRNGQRLIIGAE